MNSKGLIIAGAAMLALMIGCGPGRHNVLEPDDNTGDSLGVMVYVPASAFRMGSQTGLFDRNESPIHNVELSGYYISKYEITNEEYAKFLNDTVFGGSTHYDVDMEIVRQGTIYRAKATYEKYPVRFVRWIDAFTYAQWTGGRLPTEAEWEKAARGDRDERIFPWGNTISPGQANFGNAWGGLWKVGTASGRSPYGCCDMAGNVWEWVSDWYDQYYYSTSPTHNPTGPATGDLRVVRGGSYLNTELEARCAKRIGVEPDMRFQDVGFRCVIDSANFQAPN